MKLYGEWHSASIPVSSFTNWGGWETKNCRFLCSWSSGCQVHSASYMCSHEVRKVKWGRGHLPSSVCCSGEHRHSTIRLFCSRPQHAELRGRCVRGCSPIPGSLLHDELLGWFQYWPPDALPSRWWQKQPLPGRSVLLWYSGSHSWSQARTGSRSPSHGFINTLC